MLEPFMNLFHGVKDEDLHYRKTGRTYEQRVEEQQVRKDFVEIIQKDPEAICDFPKLRCGYLMKDVERLAQVVHKVGNHFWKSYFVNI